MPHSDSSPEPHIIQVNFGLKSKHIVAATLALMSILGTVAGSGWLMMPAKQADLTALTAVVEQTRKDQQDLRILVAGLTEQTAAVAKAVDGLQVVLKRQQRTASRPVAKPPTNTASVAQ